MSTNPFRRSSLKEVNNSASRSAPDLDGATTVPLSLDTRVPGTSQKHVNFASPPAIPISPASYPSSPESTRNSLVFSPPHNAQITPPNYSQALQSDPLRQEASTGDADSALEEALQNARANSEIVIPASTPTRESREDAVKDTLSRFASAPRRHAGGHEISDSNQASQSQRQNLDVDAFTRLLLTGESRVSAQKAAPTSVASSNAPQPASDSSSNTDTASLSQRSLFEGAHQTVEGTPRSSYELDRSESDGHRNTRVAPGSGQEARKRPPPPKPRHGRPIAETTNIPAEQSATARSQDLSPSGPDPVEPAPGQSTDVALRIEQEEDSTLGGAKKKPPPPPLARKKSQNKATTRPGLIRSGSSRYSLASESDEPLSPQASNPSTKMAPPPPPTRRPNVQAGRRQSMDLPSTLEEDDSEEVSTSVASSRTPSISKRMSQASFGSPPPVPPPRRNRDSSRSSMENQRPSLSVLGLTGPARSSSEYAKPTNASESRNVSGSSSAADILADLAALQREVDAARKHAGGE